MREIIDFVTKAVGPLIRNLSPVDIDPCNSKRSLPVFSANEIPESGCPSGVILKPIKRHLEQVRFELRQLPSSVHRLGVNHKRRQYLGITVLVRMQVEHKVHQGPLQLCTQVPINRSEEHTSE